MAANQSDPRLKSSLFIKFLVAEKCKPCEICRRMCNVNREASFSQKDIYKWVEHGFDTMILGWKDKFMEREHSLIQHAIEK